MKLVIISGVTGSIGSAIFSRLAVDPDVHILGISRKGLSLSVVDMVPAHNFVVAVDLTSHDAVADLCNKLDFSRYSDISYIHCVGKFKTEIDNTTYHVAVSNDADGDGIDDEVRIGVVDACLPMVQELVCRSIGLPVMCVRFGSLSDKYPIPCFQSWQKSTVIVEAALRELAQEHEHLRAMAYRLSTVFNVDELIARPYLFAVHQSTDYWVSPHTVAERVVGDMAAPPTESWTEREIYIPNPLFVPTYFSEEEVYRRRVKELYGVELGH